MSIETIRKCDKCDTTITEGVDDFNGQLWRVGVSAQCYSNRIVRNSSSVHNFVDGMEMDVCRKCLEGFGIHVQERNIGKATPQPPTLEDVIREIVASEMNNG
ncbi:MAG: hypothetical protein COA78_07170 [Blastopirellula sp.]|nr:MAG: hypothetical protein COA78_07170 [Blastopirellula sp.]